MESSGTITFRAYISPKRGRLLVTVLSPLLASPLYRSYPADMGADAAVERAVGHAAAIVTALAGPARVRVTWQAVLWGAKCQAVAQIEGCQEDAHKALLL